MSKKSKRQNARCTTESTQSVDQSPGSIGFFLNANMREHLGMRGNYLYNDNGAEITLVAHIDIVVDRAVNMPKVTTHSHTDHTDDAATMGKGIQSSDRQACGAPNDTTANLVERGQLSQCRGILTRPGHILGADDRAGCWILNQYINDKRVNLLWCDLEESGGYGARAFANDYYGRPNRTKLFIELDRHGTNHYVAYHGISGSLQRYLASVGLSAQVGSYSDVYEITDVLGIQSINMACGYYGEHTAKECLNIDELWNCHNTLERIISTITSEDIGEMPCRTYARTKYDAYDDIGDAGQWDEYMNKIYDASRTRKTMDLTDEELMWESEYQKYLQNGGDDDGTEYDGSELASF